ncbi:hypothetical protein [Synoicihabitans lomoniglobus]|uniref:Uncharacterized protein n=1 Tax=Synoicihabitans lomoniglobus TaxID=2909285 RepID=A0AAF0CRS4_9BACT|nr:hypothetical protein [Opitutaceae bacterium LMO-M01]WED66843.1 hypothetical protein PXH66_08270 [Opitutaceae bacterium LMO-M01]
MPRPRAFKFAQAAAADQSPAVPVKKTAKRQPAKKPKAPAKKTAKARR